MAAVCAAVFRYRCTTGRETLRLLVLPHTGSSELSCTLLQVYHWNSKRKMEEYYHTLAMMQREKGQMGESEAMDS